jgi:hypothetical protein
MCEVADWMYHDRLIKKLLVLGVDSRLVVWVRELLVRCKKRVGVRRERFVTNTVSKR